MKWYGFTNDEIFGSIMENKKYCKAILKAILPELTIKTIKTIDSQKVLGTKFDHSSKDVRLDIAVIDEQDNFYDIEMQVTKNKYLGKRMRYYQSSMDRDTLDKGLSYMDLKNTYLIFICPFDPFNRSKSKYSFHLYDDDQQSLKLSTNAETIIINSKGSDDTTPSLHNLKKLINNIPISSKGTFKEIQQTIISYNNDPKRRQLMRSAELRIKEAIGETRLEEQKKADFRVKEAIGETRLEEQKNAILAMMKTLRQVNPKLTDAQVLDMIKANFSLNLSDDELMKLINKENLS